MTALRAFVLLLAVVTLHAQQGVTVEGKVVNAVNGAPIPRATVVLRPVTNPQNGAAPIARSSYTTLTDENGHFLIAGVVPGSWTCVPSRQGYGAQPPDALGPSYFPLLNVKEGDHITDVVARLTPTGVIAGRVLDPDGDPISGAQVEVLQYGYINGTRSLQNRRMVRSDDRGEFRAFDLFPGKYYLRAAKQDNQGVNPGLDIRGTRLQLSYSTVYYPNTTDSAQTAGLDVPAGGELRGIDITLSHAGLYSIRGKISNWDRQNSRAGFNVNLQKRPRDPNVSVRQGFQFFNDGYQVPNVAPGSYVLTATLREQGPSAKPPLIARQYVEVIDHDVLNVDLNFAPGLEVSGSVRVAGSKPVTLAGLRAVLLPVEDSAVIPRDNRVGGGGSPVKADGTFTISGVAPDLYQVRVGPANAVYVVSMKVRDQEVANQTIDLNRGEAGPIAVVVSAEMGKIEGIVKDARGAVAPQANVTLIPDESRPDWPERYSNNVADTQGHFNFNNVAPGNYQLFAWQDSPRGAPASKEYRKPFERYALAVKVEPNGHATVELNLITNQPQTQANQQ